jgi:hypothetical protein
MSYLRPYGDNEEDTKILNLMSAIKPWHLGDKIFGTTLFNRGNLFTRVQNYVYLQGKRSENIWVLNVFSSSKQTSLRLRFYHCGNGNGCNVRLHAIVTLDNDNDDNNLMLAIAVKTFIGRLILKFLEGQPMTILYYKDITNWNLYSSDLVERIKQLCDEL